MELGNYKQEPYKRPECWEYCRIKAKKKKKKIVEDITEEPVEAVEKPAEILGYTSKENAKSIWGIIFFLIFLFAMCERTII